MFLGHEYNCSRITFWVQNERQSLNIRVPVSVHVRRIETEG